MGTLKEALGAETSKDAVVRDCCQLIDDEVKDKGGVSGFAIKAGYKAVQGVKPGFVRGVVVDLLPEFAEALEPIYQKAKADGGGIARYMTQHSGDVADALLAITDEKASRSTNGIVKGTYGKLRGMAKKNVETAVPRLAKLIETHAS
ncbi:MAG: hypothetical protein KC416_04210 [Myxococcales bacterium]|nr:hypothetical protein [Myxococcales bacterium]